MRPVTCVHGGAPPNATVTANGLLATQASDIKLGIPKLRKGSCFPPILERRRRIDRALYAVVVEAYVSGVSTRSVEDLIEALGVSPAIRL